MHCRDWIKKEKKKEMGRPVKGAGVVILGKQRWWLECGYYLSGDKIKWIGLEIFKGLMTNWIQRVREKEKNLK